MQGKVCVITGATSGIGLVAAERLAAMGARLLLVGRDPARGEAALRAIKARTPRADLRIVYGDLSRLSEMNRVAGEIAALQPRIDVLINNAGAMFQERGVTEDGLERSFALNHMSYFVLTNRLKDRLVAAGPARIVNTASGAHQGQSLDFADLQSERNYRGLRVYGRSKLANILFTRELARRLTGTGLTVNCLHPGFVATRIGENNNLIFRVGLAIAKRFALSPEKGAETIVYLASSPEVASVSGGYFYQSRPATPSTAARDDATAKRLWDESARIAKLPA
ncbi:MAG TPA: SDR family oxidoreductase [Stellaceae bacterium]|jgi:NAD(P)-dependent dehydrogenase (short-subunit alcohol dehydrogenase family)|nr:SDR family oxidoreductase [Stellaceae bacterium]